MARRLEDLATANIPLDKSEILITQQSGVDKQTTLQNILNAGYLSADFDTDFAAKDTDDLTEGTNKYFFTHGNTEHSENYIPSTDVTYGTLDTNGDIGTSAGQLAIGNHHHDAIYLKLDGTSAMTGALEVGTININSIDPADTATMFGTHSGGDSTMHIRIGNGVGDVIQFESWNGVTPTSLLEIGQTAVTITGDLNVTGATVTVESTTVNIEDNEIVLNSNETGTPSLDASITVERGTSTNAVVLWNETSDLWEAGVVGTTQPIMLYNGSTKAAGEFYTGSSDPNNTDRFNYDGYLYATRFYGIHNGAVTGNVTGNLTGDVTGNADTATSATTATTATSANAVRSVNFHADAVAPTGTTRLNMDGYFYATRVYNAVYNDLAEFMPKAEDAEAGQVLVMTEKGLTASKTRGDGAVVGVFSDTFGQALGADDQENKLPVGISGRVNVWVSEEVKIGDQLISGDETGFASVKRTSEDGDGKIIGKAMQNKSGSDAERISMIIALK